MELLSRQEFAVKGKASLVHLLLSILVASIAAFMVFGVWFPYPYSEISGGRSLFILITWVDVTCGPILTFVLFNRTKSRLALTIDLGLIGIVQMAALIYGVHSVMLARPIYVAYEVDRFHVMALGDILVDQLPEAREEYRTIPFFRGPKLIATQAPEKPSDEYLKLMDMTMQGTEISSIPKYWTPYKDKINDVLQRAKPLSNLKKKDARNDAIIQKAAAKTQLKEEELVYLPMQSRKSFDWIALLNAKTGEIVGFANVDGF